MLQGTAHKYEENRAKTASKGELLLALYEALFRFLRGSKICFEQDQTAKGRELLLKAHAILSELEIALDPSVAPELTQNLFAVYDFCLDQLSAARKSADPGPVDTVISVLSPLLEAWEQAVPEAARQGIATHAE